MWFAKKNEKAVITHPDSASDTSTSSSRPPPRVSSQWNGISASKRGRKTKRRERQKEVKYEKREKGRNVKTSKYRDR